MKKLIFAALVCLGFSMSASAQTFPEFTGKYVMDAANIIPDDREAALNERLIAYKNTSHNEIAVATVPSLEGRDIEGYANDFFEHLGVGDMDADSGVLLLIAPNERKVRIEVGYGLESTLTDGQSGRIIRETIVPFMKAGDYPGGIEAGANAIITATAPAAPEVASKISSGQQFRSAQSRATFWDAVLTIAGLLGIAGFIFLIYRWITAPARERRRLEKAREEERARQDYLRRQAEKEAARAEEVRRERAARKAREEAEAARKLAEETARREMLAAMSPAERQAFIAREQQAAEELRRRLEEDRAREAERRRKREREEEEDRQRRRREEDSRSSSSSSSSWSSSSSDWSSSSSSSSSSDFGGGSSGGGGASGDW